MKLRQALKVMFKYPWLHHKSTTYKTAIKVLDKHPNDTREQRHIDRRRKAFWDDMADIGIFPQKRLD